MADITPTGVVIYTDGSARPNPGFHGAGLHGYAYVYPTEKLKPTRINSWNATDKGYLLQKDLEKSDAQPVCIVSFLDSFESSLYEGTNNLAEINAPSLFFEHYPELAEVIEKLYVLADSQYMLNGATQWVQGWIKNNWISSTGKPVNNREAWERVHEHLSAFRERGQLDMAWIRGHNDDFGNVKADYLAGIATNHSTSGIEKSYRKVSEPLRYHKADVDLHPLLGLKRVYFNTHPDFNTKGTYYQTGWSGTDFIVGKRTPEAAFSVVELVEPDPIMEAVFEAQYLAPADFNAIVYAKLDRLRSADVYPYLRDHGRFCLWNDTRNLNLNFLDNKPVTIEVKAGELPLRSIDVLNHLEDVLQRFKTEYLATGTMEPGALNYTVHDVTEHFYDAGTKRVGKDEIEILTLKKDFGVGVKKTDIMVTIPLESGHASVTLPVVFQDDIPARNTLKHLEPLIPRIFIVTWRESEKMLRYSTVIQTTDALGIWSNHFANCVILGK